MKRQKGYTLVEIGFVMILVGLLGYYLINEFMDNRVKVNVKQEVDNTNKFISETMAQWTAPDFTGVTIDALRQNGVFPEQMIAGTEIHNTSRGLVTVQPATITSPNDSLTFTETMFTQTMCQKVVPRIEQGVRTLSVNGQVVKQLDTPLDNGSLGTSCKSGPNTITFQISK